MRIALFHAPPWKIPLPGQVPADDGYGPPREAPLTSLLEDTDFLSPPYGLLSIAAQALRAGHEVEVINASNFPWDHVGELLRHTEADVYGFSCFTSNRRGVDAMSRLAKQMHPKAHVTVGGPHVTPMPELVLERFTGLDSVVVGEGEATFMDLLARLEAGQDPSGLAGAVARTAQGLVRGGPRERIADLDGLAMPQALFPIDAIMTSRGCPGDCSFCASKVLWGRRLKFHSPGYVLDALEKLVKDHGLTALAIKDDTFTAKKSHTLAVCRGMVERGLKLSFSCDARVDTLDEELAEALKAAGCSRVSLGVESGSPDILASINKRTTPKQVLAATRLLKQYGIAVRFYMIVGNRGETLATFKQSLDLVREARPQAATFTLLAAFPGTREFELLQAKGVGPEIFFERDFVELTHFAGDPEEGEEILALAARLPGRLHEFSALELEEALDRLPGSPHLALEAASAHCREKSFAKALALADKAGEAGHPQPWLVSNVRACALAGLGRLKAAEALLAEAADKSEHGPARSNLERLRVLAGRTPDSRAPVTDLDPEVKFATDPPLRQPIFPTPLRLKVKKETRA